MQLQLKAVLTAAPNGVQLRHRTERFTSRSTCLVFAVGNVLARRVSAAGVAGMTHARNPKIAPRSIYDLPSALAREVELDEHLRGKELAVFLDYDGTLTYIAERPALASLSKNMRAIIASLAKRCTVTVVSGRDREDVEDLVGLDNVIYAGNHGFDIAAPNNVAVRREEGMEFTERLARVASDLQKELAGFKGVLIETKKASVAVHYRQVTAETRKEVPLVVARTLEQHPELRLTHGKMVCEIQPKVDWDKGRTVLFLLEALGLDTPDVIPIYVGDDITDEDAFRALKGRGIGVFVGNDSEDGFDERKTSADYIIRDPSEVGRLLERLAR
ncbi:MAG: trehalose-phosphatase [Alphaproteobacteria bacterium]|nr:trehalose-phosphatase [Alphaproteobacteria bacterium]